MMTPPIEPLEMTFPCTGIGQMNDWLSSSGNKVTDVQSIADSHYIHTDYDLIPEVPLDVVIKLNINLGGLSISSPAYEALQHPYTNTVDFVSSDAPNSTGWTAEQFQDFEVECADNTFLSVQSFTTEASIPTCSIISAGIRATIQFLVVGDQVERRVLKLEKLLRYEIA